jgi:hypothetical protein
MLRAVGRGDEGRQPREAKEGANEVDATAAQQRQDDVRGEHQASQQRVSFGGGEERHRALGRVEEHLALGRVSQRRARDACLATESPLALAQLLRACALVEQVGEFTTLRTCGWGRVEWHGWAPSGWSLALPT